MLQVPEVDNCLTTGELHKLLEQHGVHHLAHVPCPRPPDSLLLLTRPPAPAAAADGAPKQGPLQQQHKSVEDGQLYGLPGGSGGYMDFVMRWAVC